MLPAKRSFDELVAAGTIELRTFDSAQSAFAGLNADSVPFAKLARQKLLQIGTAYSTLDPWTCPGGFYRPQCGNSAYWLICELLTNTSKIRLSNKTWKCVKIKDSEDVCFYSDSYGLKWHSEQAETLASVCSNVGLDVRIFEWHYPNLMGKQSYYPPKTARVISSGYEYLYRGNLVGFVVGAYNNPFKERTVTRIKKRRRKF